MALEALMISLIRGTPRVMFMEATPAKWKVFRVIWVPGSPMLWAQRAPTAEPGSICALEGKGMEEKPSKTAGRRLHFSPPSTDKNAGVIRVRREYATSWVVLATGRQEVQMEAGKGYDSQGALITEVTTGSLWSACGDWAQTSTARRRSKSPADTWCRRWTEQLVPAKHIDSYSTGRGHSETSLRLFPPPAASSLPPHRSP